MLRVVQLIRNSTGWRNRCYGRTIKFYEFPKLKFRTLFRRNDVYLKLVFVLDHPLSLNVERESALDTRRVLQRVKAGLENRSPRSLSVLLSLLRLLVAPCFATRLNSDRRVQTL